MGKAKKLAAAALTVLALVTVTATHVAQGGGEGVHVACQGGTGGGGCYG